MGFIFMHDVLGELCRAFVRAHFCIFFISNAKYMYFQWNKVKKSFFEVGVFKQGDVVEQMFQKGYKISLECI